ncbi:ABC transporter ATP-binding protein [Azospirillum doebereinerae]
MTHAEILAYPAPHLAATEPLLAIAGATKSFEAKGRPTLALDDVSLSLARGEFVSLIGPSGCGKTTLLNLVAGLTAPDRGRVTFGGRPVDGPNTQVGYLTQDDAVLPWRSVLGNVMLPLEIRRVPKVERRERARAMIRRVGLEGFESHYPSQLSGGMRKRMSLARTLVYSPDFLLLDEPFGALDAQTRVLMQRELLGIVRDLGLTVMLVTHDLHEAIALSDRILVFSKRPARVIETVTLPQPRDRDPLHRSRADEAVHRRLWDTLAAELEAGAGTKPEAGERAS